MSKFGFHTKPETDEELQEELPSGVPWGEYLLECIELRKKIEGRDYRLEAVDTRPIEDQPDHTLEISDEELELVLSSVDTMMKEMDRAGDDEASNGHWKVLKRLIEESEHDLMDDSGALMFDPSRYRK